MVSAIWHYFWFDDIGFPLNKTSDVLENHDLLQYQFRYVHGVMLFNIYMAVLFAWIAIIFKDTIMKYMPKQLSFVGGLIDKIAKVENALELFLGFLAIVLAAYTGFLLSALKTYPMLNNPVLPILFLFL